MLSGLALLFILCENQVLTTKYSVGPKISETLLCEVFQ